MIRPLDRLPSLALAALCAAAAGAAAPAPVPAQERAGVEACRVHISSLRYRIGGAEALDESDHELLGGLSAAEAGAPRENWFGEPPEREVLLLKLQDAVALAEAGDGAACLRLVEEVRSAIAEPGGLGGDG